MFPNDGIFTFKCLNTAEHLKSVHTFIYVITVNDVNVNAK